MSSAHRIALVGATLALLGGCADVPETLTAGELLAEPPQRYEGATLTVVGTPLSHFEALNAGPPCVDREGAPVEGVPCNNGWGHFAFVDGDAFLGTRPAAGFPYPEVARGQTEQPCYDAGCRDGVQLGCHGNEREMLCAPTLPQNIERVIGRVTRTEAGDLFFEVDDLVLAEERVFEDGVYRGVDAE